MICPARGSRLRSIRGPEGCDGPLANRTMPEEVRVALIAFSLTFVAVGGYYRIQSQRSGERLDRTKEGWPILIGIRLLGLLTVGATTAWLWKPVLFEWASRPIPTGVRWIGVASFACATAWLTWMFHALGRNLRHGSDAQRCAFGGARSVPLC
jgi:hypothetical protein